MPSAAGTLILTAHEGDLLRLGLLPEGQSAARPAHAVATLPAVRNWDVLHEPSAEAPLELSSGGLHLTLGPPGASLRVADAQARLLLEEAAGGLLPVAAAEASLRLHLPWWQQVFGLGEKTGPVNRRGCAFTFWNTDEAFYRTDADPLYKSVPFWFTLRDGVATGFLVDHGGRLGIDLGRRDREVLEIHAEAGPLDLWVLPGPSPAEVLRRYVDLTGRPALPPRWGLGFHQCRYSYRSQERVLELARKMREHRIPCDGLWLDIHHMDGFRSFTWDEQAFPDPGALVRELHDRAFSAVAIVDPGLAVDPAYAPYAQARERGFLVTDEAGDECLGDVWPGSCAFPDFLRAEVRSWWGGLVAAHASVGLDGIWVDMNEPSLWRDERTLPDDAVHGGEAGPVRHGDVHNLYGTWMARAAWEALAAERPDHRPFVLTRATSPGGQRWGACWSGDNRSTWEHLRLSLALALNTGVCGLPFNGPDIGGFADAPDPELFTRWLQLGAFFGLMRVHTCIDSPDQEPWSFGEDWEGRNRAAIELRYELLPYLESLAHAASVTGTPPLRPVWFEHPGAYDLAALEDQFLFGRDLLVAPALTAGCRWRTVSLPPGRWYAFPSGMLIREGSRATLAAPLETVPMLARAGAIIPMQGIVQSTREAPGPELDVLVFPGADGTFTLVEDAGDGPPGDQGAERRTRFSLQSGERRMQLRVEVLCRDHPRRFDSFRIIVHGILDQPLRVSLDGEPEPVREPSEADARCVWDARLHALRLALDHTCLPATLDVATPHDLPATPIEPRLDACPVDAVTHPVAMLAGAERLEAGPFWRTRDLPVELEARWAERSLTVTARLRHPGEGQLRPSLQAENEGLELAWRPLGQEAVAGVRVGPGWTPGSAASVERDGPHANGTDGSWQLDEEGVLITITLPAPALGLERLEAGTELGAGIAFQHSDGAGWRTRLAWWPHCTGGPRLGGRISLNAAP